MQVAAVGMASWLFLLLAGGTGALTNLGAPLPLDPALSAIAPENCLWYGATAGMAAADPNSSNETEKLFAEPAIQKLLASIESQLMAALDKARAQARPDEQVVMEHLPMILKTLVTRPIAGYVAEVQIRPEGPPAIEAALVLGAGEQRTEFEAALTALLGQAAQQGMQTTAETVAGVAWQRVATPPEAPPVRFGWNGDYFIIAIGESTPADLIGRMSGAAPEWLTKLRAEHPIAREYSIGYLNVAGLMSLLQPIVAAEDPEAWPAVERLGLTHVRAVHGVTGLDDVGFARMTHVATDGQRVGLLGFLPHEPLAAEDLNVIPKDAMIAVAGRLDPSEVLEHALALASQFDPRAREEFNRGMQQAQAETGVNLPQEIVASIGDAWIAYLPAGDLMTSWWNAAAGVRVKNAPALRAAVAKLVASAKAEMARGGAPASINESTVDGRPVYTVQFRGAPIPISPTWTVSDDWIVFGLMPSAVQATVDRAAADSLAEAPAVLGAMSGDRPAALVYADVPQLVRMAYPWIQIGVQMVASQARQAGVEIDASAMPVADVIVKHLRPHVTTLSHQADGFHCISRGSIPGGSNVASAPIVVGLLLPAMGSAREAAQRSQELNSLKMLGLGALNHESATRVLPFDITSEDGKPLLSWRVRVLPYLEEQALYSQFNLDEPWDSENNLRLLEFMPEVFRSPSSPDLGNRTRFLALKGPATLFPPNESIPIRNVTDGTSNTILFVQAAPEAAVEWTRPADIAFDEDSPFAGLMMPSGEFLAGFCDGSVRSLSLAIGDAAMRALATRGGGEVVDHDALWQPPAPHLYQIEEAEPASAAPIGAGLDK